MNDHRLDQKIAAAFNTMPPADVYLKNQLLNLPERKKKVNITWKLAPAMAALVVVAVVGIIALRGPGGIEPPPPHRPLIQHGSMLGGGAMGYEAHMNRNADELRRGSPAHGREGELGVMPVYRNPLYGIVVDEAMAMEIAEQFNEAIGRTFVYVPPTWLDGVEQKIRETTPPEHLEQALWDNRQQDWEFINGDERFRVRGYDSSTGVTLNVPLPDPLPQIADPVARYEAISWQVYERYADAIEAITGLRFNAISTAFSYYSTGDKHFNAFLYVNNPDDPLAKQAEDYALRRLEIGLIEEPGEECAFLHFAFAYPGAEDLLDHYPVMDLEGAKRELLAGHYESSVTATREELARATIEEAELIYSNRPWLSTWLPMYRLYLTFAPNDMHDWGNNIPWQEEMGLRNFYVFYVPAVPAEYLLPQEGEGSIAMFG